jgi:hypothetical protein
MEKHRCARCGGELKIIVVLSDGTRIAKCRPCDVIQWIDPARSDGQGPLGRASGAKEPSESVPPIHLAKGDPSGLVNIWP